MNGPMGALAAIGLALCFPVGLILLYAPMLIDAHLGHRRPWVWLTWVGLLFVSGFGYLGWTGVLWR